MLVFSFMFSLCVNKNTVSSVLLKVWKSNGGPTLKLKENMQGFVLIKITSVKSLSSSRLTNANFLVRTKRLCDVISAI